MCAWRSDCVTNFNVTRHQFCLSLEVHLRWDQSSFWLTIVYGHVEDTDKEGFLAKIITIKPNGTALWIIMGDFNMIYKACDKNNLNLNRRLMGQFRQTLDGYELIEFTLQNWRYTWSNERAEPTLIGLDRVFCNQEWDLKFSGFNLQALSSSISDHCPLPLCQQARPKRQQRFRFESFWTRIPRFLDVVQGAWNEQVPGISPLNIMFFKMQCTARALRAWSNKLFGSARIELHMPNEIIQRLYAAREIRQLTIEELYLCKDLKCRVLGLTAIEHSWRRQSSRLVWLKEGDACTKFFHLKANDRARKNFIPCLKEVNGNFVWSHREKEQILHNYFQDRLGTCEQRTGNVVPS
jgi:hypothetical protein